MVMRKKITKTADVTKNRIDRTAEWGVIVSKGEFFFHALASSRKNLL